MKRAPIPENEKERLAELLSYDVLDSEAEQLFDELTALASQICGTPIALISLVDPDRQWFKSRQCMDVAETPRNISFCTYAIAEEEYLIVSDAKADKLFANNPLVTGSPFIRAYAGVILRNQDGYELGTLCLLYEQAREFTEDEINKLKHYARLVETIIFTNP